MREGHCRVGEGRHQRAELLTVLRALEDPGLRSAQKCQRLQDFLHVRVVPVLVEAQVIVPPVRHARMPFQDVAGQIQVEQFDFLLDRLGEPVVHGGHHGGAGHECVVLGLGSRVAGVDAEDVRPLSERRDRILALPVRQRAPARIGGDEIHQMGGAGSRHPDDDEGFLDRDRLDLGIPLDEVGQREPVAQQANHSLPQRRTGELGQTFVGFDRGHVRGQAVVEAVGVVQVVSPPGLVDRFGKHLIDVEFDVFGLGELQNLTLDVGQLGRRQIVEVDVSDVAGPQNPRGRLLDLVPNAD